MFSSGLPIDCFINEICNTLEKNQNLILTAEPGTGKSTIFPLNLLRHFPNQKFIMLEPRKIAARSIAKRIAYLLGENVGEHIGYITRFEHKTSSLTSLTIVTEQILVRMLQENPGLNGISGIIFDEFHERNLHSDLAFVLVQESRKIFHPDLKLIIMSATIDADFIAKKLDGKSAVFNIPGENHHVTVYYSPPQKHENLLPHIATLIQKYFCKNSGDILVFLPGEREIHHLHRILEKTSQTFDVLELYGNLPQEKQDAIFQCNSEKQRVILSTSIAETSITIPKIQCVIDSGLRRLPFFSIHSGITHLRTVNISKASAKQRTGRAGRTAQGICYRTWSLIDENLMPLETEPEIEHSDLTGLLLELLFFGILPKEIKTLNWMTPPPETAIQYSFSILRTIGAIQRDGTVTYLGKNIHQIPCHPRIANALIFAASYHVEHAAARLLAFLETENLFLNDLSSDIETKIAQIDYENNQYFTLRKIESQLITIVKSLNILKRNHLLQEEYQESLILCAAFPDRIAKRKDICSFEYTLCNGSSACMHHSDKLQQHEYIIVAHAGGITSPPKISLALPIELTMLKKFFPEFFTKERNLVWDSNSGKIHAFETLKIGVLNIEQKQVPLLQEDDTASILISILKKQGIQLLNFSNHVKNLKERLSFFHFHFPKLCPDFSDEALLNSLEIWLLPYMNGISAIEQLSHLNFQTIFLNILPINIRAQINQLIPEFFQVPSGTLKKIDYSNPKQPTIHVKLQELFGMTATPTLTEKKIPIVFDILSPSNHTIQITSNLQRFWNGSYQLVIKDMRARYPKHIWPENPLYEKPVKNTLKLKNR